MRRKLAGEFKFKYRGKEEKGKLTRNPGAMLSAVRLFPVCVLMREIRGGGWMESRSRYMA